MSARAFAWRATAAVLVLGAAPAQDPRRIEQERQRLPAQVSVLCSRVLDYAREGDPTRGAAVLRILEPLAVALDEGQTTRLAAALREHAAAADSAALVQAASAVAYGDLLACLRQLERDAGLAPRTARRGLRAIEAGLAVLAAATPPAGEAGLARRERLRDELRALAALVPAAGERTAAWRELLAERARRARQEILAEHALPAPLRPLPGER